MTLAEQVQQAGVVGAGGGGFPTHVKLMAKADTVIANGAECEPLLHKDAAVMEHLAGQVVAGVQLAMQAVSAQDGVIAVKAKNQKAVETLRAACQNTPVRVHLLGDYYPAGDEYDLVHEVTGRLIPPAGIPIQVGVVVNNVETLVNITAAAAGQPVIRKMLTIAGAVRQPLTLTLPIGTTFRDAIALAGGLTVPDPVLCVGGLMMGLVTGDLDTPITKTTTGVVILPRDHPVMERRLKPAAAQARIGKSACDQCRYCTEFCPRFLLGYAVEPHQVMRSLAFTAAGQERWNAWAWLCCACGLCTWYACPEMLFPKEACDESKAELRQANFKWTGPVNVRPHPMRADRRVPIKRLARKLQVQDYDAPAPLRDTPFRPKRLVLPLKQSAGAACQPVVQPGDRVREGQVIGTVPPKTLGAVLHAPLNGVVTAVTDRIVLETEL